jgi:nucleotide-binding universal stress UspA family protein
MAYRHILVAYDGTCEGDEAVTAADLIAQQMGARLTIAVVVQLEPPPKMGVRCLPGTRVWNDVLLDAARADLERASRLVHRPAALEVLLGPPGRALPDGAQELGCDAIMVPPRPRSRLARMLSRDRTAALRGRSSCAVLTPR